jgi:saccharopine dehydrogenase (NAD+, L-lysine-forming)
MGARIAIRREDKGRWERRVPLSPRKVKELHGRHGIEVLVQPSSTRIFPEESFLEAGGIVQEDISSAPIVFGVKEIPPQHFQPGATYVFFAHVIKGQPHNMAMLKRMMELGCNLIDYEKVTNEQGRRLIFFGWHAGVAGMIDSLWALGQRLEWEGIPTPFSDIANTYTYAGLDQAKSAVRAAGERVRAEGVPAAVAPVIIGVAGYGNAGRGVQVVLDELAAEEIEPAEVVPLSCDPNASRHTIFRVTFKEQHIVEPLSKETPFELQDYYRHPEKYRACFDGYSPHLTMLVNCNYWDSRYPRLVTKAFLRTLYARGAPRLRVIGDVSCDMEGAIECTIKSTAPDDPVFVYEPETGTAIDGVAGRGPVVLAVDILPSEMPREASEYFSDILGPYVPAMARADYSVAFAELDLPSEIKRAVILHHGELTPDYAYIEQYLD